MNAETSHSTVVLPATSSFVKGSNREEKALDTTPPLKYRSSAMIKSLEPSTTSLLTKPAPGHPVVNEDVPTTPSLTSNLTPSDASCLHNDAPSDECSQQGDPERRCHPLNLLLDAATRIMKPLTIDEYLENKESEDGFSIETDDSSSVCSDVTLDKVFKVNEPPTPPEIPSSTHSNVWSIEVLDGKHERGDTLWFRVNNHKRETNNINDEEGPQFFKYLEGVEVLDFVYALEKVQKTVMYCILKENGEYRWLEGDTVKDGVTNILLQSKQRDEIVIPSLQDIEKMGRKRQKKKRVSKRRWFFFSRPVMDWS